MTPGRGSSLQCIGLQQPRFSTYCNEGEHGVAKAYLSSKPSPAAPCDVSECCAVLCCSHVGITDAAADPVLDVDASAFKQLRAGEEQGAGTGDMMDLISRKTAKERYDQG